MLTYFSKPLQVKIGNERREVFKGCQSQACFHSVTRKLPLVSGSTVRRLMMLKHTRFWKKTKNQRKLGSLLLYRFYLDNLQTAEMHSPNRLYPLLLIKVCVSVFIYSEN